MNDLVSLTGICGEITKGKRGIIDITQIMAIMCNCMAEAEIKVSDAQCDTSRCYWEGQRVAFRTALKVITDANEYAMKYAKIINDLREENNE